MATCDIGRLPRFSFAAFASSRITYRHSAVAEYDATRTTNWQAWRANLYTLRYYGYSLELHYTAT